MASGAFDEQTLEDTSSPQACVEDLGQLREDSQYPTDGQSVTGLLDPLTIQNTAIQDSITLEVQSTQEVTQKAISTPVSPPADELRTSAKVPRIQVTPGEPQLINAASLGQAVVQRLLEKGANVNAMSDGRTALVLAAIRGHEAVVQLLLENGADVNADEMGRTVLMWAAFGGHEVVVRLLLENGADVNAKGDERTGYRGTALMLAAEIGHEAVVRLLLENGADINAKWDGETAFGLASRSGHDAVALLLLDKVVDENFR